MNSFKTKSFFAFFNKQISQKYGQKCCRYNQNGKPLPKQTVDQLYSTLKDMMQGWQIEQDSRRLVRHFYTEDYLMAVQFMKEIAKIDALTTKNCPSFQLEKGEVLTVRLYSPSLDGLSQVDFELAMAVNRVNLQDYFLIPIDDVNDYKKQIQAYRLKRQSDEIQKKLQAEFGGK